MNKILVFIGLTLLMMFGLPFLFGSITIGWITAILLAAGAALIFNMFPVNLPIPAGWRWVVGGFLIVVVAMQAGLSFDMLTASVAAPASLETQETLGACSVSQELLGKTSTLDVNAWDQESNTPYSAAVDFTTNCFIYKNSNSPENYIGPSADTAAEELSGFAVGDKIFYYCGGTTYYADPIENLCVNSQRQPLSINAHTIAGESNMQIVAYDDSGSTALDAVGSTNYGDYNLTLGAGSEESIYVKLKVNAANMAYHFCGWGTAVFYNVSSVEPTGVESTYTKVATPEHMKSIGIEVNSTGNNLTKDYTFYKAASVIKLREWDSIKEQFVVKADATNDPIDAQKTATGANMNGFAILAKDCTYSRGDDGMIHYDFYTHDTAESDVGMAETETSPRGKQTGVQICTL